MRNIARLFGYPILFPVRLLGQPALIQAFVEFWRG